MSKEYAKSFYQSKEWIKCRKGYIKSKYCICERCGRSATIVHHKKFINPRNINNPEITLNWDNLEALCIECHNKIHNRNHQVTTKETIFDENGNLIKSPQ
ncbi:HNH endonuclease [Clostridium kluyveri]|uniref:HNH endonuclease n=1 Tax=Clostridium kluyveri TaxID=1534 RepID=A0A1L5F2T2_CLOKL|nr:HNH endonuclease [Clostridium kluyveri]APM37297.1 HNH endonuclease [Clostridium kluyveri]